MTSDQTSKSSFRRTRENKLLWISLWLLLALAAIWVGLNVIRVSTYNYAADYQRHLGDFRQLLYWYVIKTQDYVFWLAEIDLVFGLLAFTAVAIQRICPKTS